MCACVYVCGRARVRVQTSVDQGMYFHGVKFESGLDDYDDLWRRAGFDVAEQIDMGGVYIDRTNKIAVDPRCERHAQVCVPQCLRAELESACQGPGRECERERPC
jgi:hypothetical protein